MRKHPILKIIWLILAAALACYFCSCRRIQYEQQYCIKWHKSITINPVSWRRVKKYMRDSTKFTDQSPVKEFERDQFLINQFWNNEK